MGDHRAPRGARRRPLSRSAAPSGGARRALPADTIADVPAAAVSAPLIAELTESPTVVMPLLAPAVEPVVHTAAGKRRAARTPQRGLRLLPSAPLVAGVATLAVAGLGATSSIDDSDTQAAAQRVRISAAGALSGTSATSSSDLLSARGGGGVSRSSSRDALADATDSELVEQAEATAEERDAALAQFAKKAESRAATIAKNAWVAPLSGYHFSASFGAASYLWSHLHTGQDLGAPTGTQIHNVANGVVTETGYDGSYGNKTVVTLDDGTEIWYCHQTSILVSVGERVTSDQIIGLVGSTGNSTGPHLHIEVRPGGGDPVDPVPAFVQHGIVL